MLAAAKSISTGTPTLRTELARCWSVRWPPRNQDGTRQHHGIASQRQQSVVLSVYGKGIAGPWAVSVDGNDNIRISNLTTASSGIVELCGFRTQNCPPGMETGYAISPPGGYVGGGLQMQVDVKVGPAGDVWVTNNWQYYPAALGKVEEALSTLGGGQGIVVSTEWRSWCAHADRSATTTVAPAKCLRAVTTGN